MKPRCVCGCGRRGAHDHHAVTRGELRRHTSPERSFRQLETDRRNIVRVSFDCHLAHHNASERYPLTMLPDSVFEFAAELMGAPTAFAYLSRYYDGADPRLDALLTP